MARAQIAIEFSLMVMLAFVFLVAVLVVILFYVEHAGRERTLVTLEDEAARLQGELLLASGVEDGYERIVTVPLTLDGADYTIESTETVLTLTLNGESYNAEVPQATGSFAKGPNRVRKAGGALLIDQP